MIYNHFLFVHKHLRLQSHRGVWKYRVIRMDMNTGVMTSETKFRCKYHSAGFNLYILYSLDFFSSSNLVLVVSCLRLTQAETLQDQASCAIRVEKKKRKKKKHVTTAERAVSLLTMWWCCFFASCSSSHLIWCKWQHRWFTGDRTLSQSNFITNVLSINKNTLPEGTREKKRSHISTFIYKNHPDKNTGTFSVETTRNDHDLPLGALIAQN